MEHTNLFRKGLSIVLSVLLLAGILFGCSKKSEKKVVLREDLLEYGGDFWTKENKKTAEKFVSDIEDTYHAYQKDGDLEEYADDVCTIVDKNQKFVDDVVETLSAADEQAKANGDFDLPLQIFSLKLDMLNIGARKTDILQITEFGFVEATDEELEQKVNTVVNLIMSTFCNTEIAE